MKFRATVPMMQRLVALPASARLGTARLDAKCALLVEVLMKFRAAVPMMQRLVALPASARLGTARLEAKFPRLIFAFDPTKP